MKVLLVNGSPKAKGCTYTALQEAAAALEKPFPFHKKNLRISAEKRRKAVGTKEES